MGLVGRCLQRIAAAFHALAGRVTYRLGWRAHARRHFEQVLMLRGDDFGSYVHLGLIAFGAGDYAGWRREYEHARRTDPDRFARLRHPFELFEPRLAGTEFDGTRDRATWRTMRPLAGGRPRRLRLRGDDEARRPEPTGETPAMFDPQALADALHETDTRRDGLPADGQRSALLRDDCGSTAERQRLRALGPIRRSDLASVDLDELSRRLTS